MNETDNLMNLWNQKVGQPEEEQETSSANKQEEKSNKDKLLDSWNNSAQAQAQEEQEQPQMEQPEVNRANIIINDEKEDQGLLGITWDSMKSGVVRTGAGLLKFSHESNYNKNTYKDVIKEYGSIEKAMEAEDPRALLAQRYETQDGEVIEATEYLSDISARLAPDVEQDVVSAFKEGRWGDFIEGTVSGVAQNIPDLIMRGLLTAGTGNPWLATTHIFGSVAGQKMIEMEGLEQYSDNEKMMIAGLQGSIEYLAERLGTGNMLNSIVKKMGMEQAKGFVRTALVNGIKGYFAEGSEEFVTEWAQSGVDYIFGLQTEWDWGKQWNQALNAFTIGGFTGFGMQVAGSALQKATSNTKTETNQNESSFNTKFILKETGDRTFDKRVEFVDNMVSTGTQYAQELGLDPRMVVALMGHESNFRHIKAVDKSSSAFGALQMNDGAMKTVMDNYELQNDPDSVEGRIEAGVKYLHWIKTNYGFTGDALVASYYAGAGEIRKNGVHNRTIYEGSASPQEYLNEFHNMLEIINQSMGQDIEVEVETETVAEEASNLLTPESEEWLSQYFEDEMNNIELKDEQGQWTDDALSEFARIREEYGNPNDPVFTNNSGARFTPEFKKALSESLQDKVETLEGLGEDPNNTKAPELLKVFQKEGISSPDVEVDNQGGVQDGQGQETNPEQIREVLRVSEERAYETGIFKEGNKEAYERNNTLIAENTVEQHDPITDNGSPSFEINNSEVYYDMIVEAKKNNDYGAFVDESNPEDLAGKRLFVYNGGAMGFALEPDGNITNVFKNSDLTTEEEVGHEMLMKALAEGGNRLDFFNGFLTKLYTSHGFIPVAKTDFVDEFSPEGWNYKRDGRPPVVFAVHNGDSLEQVEENYKKYKYSVEDAKQVDDYMAGKEAQEQAYESGVELLAVQREFDSIDDKRTSRARELKQKIRDLEFIQEFEKTDESIDEAYKRIEQELEQVEDKRTKEGRELKAKLHALKEYTMRQMDKAVEKSTEKSSNKAEGTDTVKIRTEINQELKKKAQEYIRLKAKEGVNVTEEEAVRLMTFNKPANGNAINTTVLDTDNPEILKLFDEVAQILKGESEETFKNIEADAEQSFSKEGQRLERELGLITKDAKVLAKVMQKAPSVVFRFQHLVSKSAEQVTETAKELNATMSTLSELELANFAKQVQAHFSLTNDLLDIKSGWGRTGVAMKHKVNGKMVDADTIDPRLYENDLDAQSKVRASIDTLGGAKKLKQMIKDIAGGNYDLEGLNQRVRESTNKKITRAILENMSISVLGQWKTHIANIISQATFTIYQNMINYSQASANLLVKEESAMDFAKANAYLIASVKGFADSFVNPLVSMNDAGKAMFGEDLSGIELAILAFKDSRKFEAIREASGLTSRAQVELQRTHNLDMDSLFGDKGKNTPLIKHLRIGLDYINSFRRSATFGLLQAGDKPFASAGYHAQLSLEIIELQRSLGDTVDGVPKAKFLEGLAEKAIATRKIKQLENVIEYRILREAGTESEEAQDALRRKIYSELTGGVLDQVTPFEMEVLNRIDQKAIQHSDEMTWKDEFEEGTFLRDAEKWLNAHPMGKILGFLFFHTPMKILQRAQQDTIRFQLLPDLLGKNGKKAQVEALGTTAVTYGIIGMSVFLYLTNGMTGTPRDKKERELMRQAGVPENSIKINGKWLSFNRLEPMGYLLSLGANGARALHEALEDPDTDNSWMLAGQVFGEVFASMAQTMMNKSSLTGVLRTVNMLVNGGGYGYMKGLLETNNPLYSVKRNITDISYGGVNPFFKENYVQDAGVMARDMFGKPIVKYDSLTQMNPMESTDSPVRQEIYDLQLKLSGFGNVFNGVKLTDQQRNEVLKYFDEVIEAEKQMNNYVNSNSYNNLSSPQKRLALERYWTQLKSQAQMQMMRDSRFMKEYRELQEEEQDNFLNDKEYSETMFRDGEKFKKVKDIIERINLFKRGE